MRAVRGIDDEVPAPRLDGLGAAARGTGVLRVDRLHRPPGVVDEELHHLPVAGVAAGAHDAAVLVLAAIERNQCCSHAPPRPEGAVRP